MQILLHRKANVRIKSSVWLHSKWYWFAHHSEVVTPHTRSSLCTSHLTRSSTRALLGCSFHAGIAPPSSMFFLFFFFLKKKKGPCGISWKGRCERTYDFTQYRHLKIPHTTLFHYHPSVRDSWARGSKHIHAPPVCVRSYCTFFLPQISFLFSNDDELSRRLHQNITFHLYISAKLCGS